MKVSEHLGVRNKEGFILAFHMSQKGQIESAQKNSIQCTSDIKPKHISPSIICLAELTFSVKTIFYVFSPDIIGIISSPSWEI